MYVGNIVSKDSSTEGDSDKEKDEEDEGDDDNWAGEDQSDEFRKITDQYFPRLSHSQKKERLV
jgi:hypothetical protein